MSQNQDMSQKRDMSRNAVIVSKSGYVPKRVQESLKTNSHNLFIILGWNFFMQCIVLAIFYNYMVQFCSTRHSFKDI